MTYKFLNVHHACTRYVRVKKANGRIIFLPIIVLPLVVTKRVKVANELYKKNDGQLLTAGRAYVVDMTTASSTFTLPVPTLPDVTTELDSFENLMVTARAVPTPENTRNKNVQREAVLNILSALGSYVETVSNSSAPADAISIIESAGMRPQSFTNRRRRIWDVTYGGLSGMLKLTAEATRGATHEWAWTTTPTDDNSWTNEYSSKSTHFFTGLTRGSYVSCRHRTIVKGVVSDWEGHDPMLVI